MAHLRRRSDGFDGAFQAQPQHAGGDELILHGPHVVDGDLRVGTRRVDDDVLAFGVHHDDGGSARPQHTTHVRHVDTGLFHRKRRSDMPSGLSTQTQPTRPPALPRTTLAANEAISALAASLPPSRLSTPTPSQ